MAKLADTRIKKETGTPLAKIADTTAATAKDVGDKVNALIQQLKDQEILK